MQLYGIPVACILKNILLINEMFKISFFAFYFLNLVFYIIVCNIKEICATFRDGNRVITSTVFPTQNKIYKIEIQ